MVPKVKKIKVEFVDVLGHCQVYEELPNFFTELWVTRHMASPKIKAVTINVAQELLYCPSSTSLRNNFASDLAHFTVRGNALVVPKGFKPIMSHPVVEL